MNGGGSCQWQLNSLKVSSRIADDVALVKGKKVIATNDIFDFGNYDLAIPDELTENELIGWLGDMYHEAATERNPKVTRVE